MNKIKCLVLDDEPIGKEIIENFVQNTPFLSLCASFEDPIEAVNYIENNDIDVLFTDIQMPHLNGIQLINSLTKKPLIIFITAFENYAIDSFEFGVADYLLKPVSYDRFLKSAIRVKETLNKKNIQVNIKPEEDTTIDRIFIKSDNKLVKIMLDDIIYIEALKDYIRIHISEKERYVTHSTMKALEEKLPSNFFRIQRSYIINTRYIKSFYGNTVKLTIGENLPISTKSKTELFKNLGLEEI